MFFYIFCGLLLLNVFAAAAATPSSNSTGLLDRIKKLLVAAKEKLSKIISFKSKTLRYQECYDQAPEECSRLYAKGVCNYKDIAKEYCRTTCGFCTPKNHGLRSKEYIMSDEWDKIPTGLQPTSRANHVKNLGFDSMFEDVSQSES